MCLDVYGCRWSNIYNFGNFLNFLPSSSWKIEKRNFQKKFKKIWSYSQIQYFFTFYWCYHNINMATILPQKYFQVNFLISNYSKKVNCSLCQNLKLFDLIASFCEAFCLPKLSHHPFPLLSPPYEVLYRASSVQS